MSVSESKREPERVRRLSADERRRALVLATYELIAEKGFEQLRTRDIAARAGVNIATLHYYFASKEDLIQGVVDHVLQLFSQSRPSQAAGFSNPLEEVLAMLLNVEHWLRSSPELFVVLSEIGLRSLRDEALRAPLQRLEASWRAYLEPLIAAGIAQGHFRPDLDPQEVTTDLIVLIEGLTFYQIISRQRADIQQLLAQVKRWLLPSDRRSDFPDHA